VSAPVQIPPMCQHHHPMSIRLLIIAFFCTIIYGITSPVIGREVVHYFHFNQIKGPQNVIVSNISKTSPPATIQYRPLQSGSATADDVEGSALNSYFQTPAGNGLRVRNPSINNELILTLPTTGFKNLRLDYATQRTNNGMLFQQVFYSPNGINYQALGDPIPINAIQQFQLVSIDLSHLNVANHNETFHIRIRFLEQNQSGSGNNRFDNVVLSGEPLTSALQPIHYWHFNQLTTVGDDIKEIPSDLSVFSENALLRYTGFGLRDMDVFDEGTLINSIGNETAGQALRVRNPAFNRYLLLKMNTGGYRNIRFSYAVHRSSNGMQKHLIEYTTDGIHFDRLGDSINIETEYQCIIVDFKDIESANNNPLFAIRIAFAGNTISDDGNNRIDNIVLEGVPSHLSGHTSAYHKEHSIRLYPNPTSGDVNIFSLSPVTHFEITDAIGRKIPYNLIDNGIGIQLPSILPPGIYYCMVSTTEGTKTIRLVRR
jgi:hypothetical protein